MDKKTLLEKLSAVEFCALDMQQYLDTHPNDTQAIALYNQFVTQAMDVREEYENAFGPLYSFVSMSDENHFGWINQPWPWEREFNHRK